MKNFTEIAFSEAVKQIQCRKGSRTLYEDMDRKAVWTNKLTSDLKAFIENQNSCYLGTVSKDGQPYIQHRGGPPGFLRVLDDETVAFVDFKGNRQFISQGNLQDNDKAFLFLMDYANQRRLKLWGTASVIENDKQLTKALMPSNYQASAEQVIIFRITLWNFNCRRHIPVLSDEQTIIKKLAEKDKQIA